MPDTRPPFDAITVADALAQLPLETPVRSAWPTLAEHIQPHRTPRARRPWALAAAAVMVAAIVLPLSLQDRAPHDADNHVTSNHQPTLQRLMAESEMLERLLTELRDPGMASASNTVISLYLEDQLGAIDAQLSLDTLAEQDRLALWQERVTVLRDYAGMESTYRWMASEGDQLDTRLVAVF